MMTTHRPDIPALSMVKANTGVPSVVPIFPICDNAPAALDRSLAEGFNDGIAAKQAAGTMPKPNASR